MSFNTKVLNGTLRSIEESLMGISLKNALKAFLSVYWTAVED